MGNKNTITDIYRKQAYESNDTHDSICGYVCIGFIDFMLKGIENI